MFVLGSLPPYEHVCVCLSVRAYVPECTVCAFKHASVRVCECARAWGRMCDSVRPSVCLSVCPRSCVQMFDRTSVRSSMHAFVCLHAHVREGVCLSPYVRPSVLPSVCLSACIFVRPNVCSHIRPQARAHAKTRTLECLHAHTMHSGTYARTDWHTHTYSYGGKHPSTNMEVRS